MPVTLDLHYVAELIDVRQQQHGGLRGAPAVVDGYRKGESLNRSCAVMLSALLQGFVEGVFVAASSRALPILNNSGSLEKYRKTFRHWGNPSTENIVTLFGRIGIDDVLSNLSWRNCANSTVRTRLNHLNQIRNAIAHGNRELNVDGRVVSLSLGSVRGYKDFVEKFGARFEAHVIRQIT
jgi:HEPN superfamily RiboL-PSP-like protein